MLRSLLICGLLAGLLAGLTSFAAATVLGEPALNQAIAYEEAHSAPQPAVMASDGHQHSHGDQAEVSRGTQSTVGLLTGTSVYGLAFGGLFALVFAFLYGRIAAASPRITATWLGLGGFVTIFLVPFIKYPATPPAIGSADTIGSRTLLYFGMMVIALLAAFVAVRARAWLLDRRPDVATLGGLACFLVIVAAAGVSLPGVHEIPADFSATALWSFRTGSIATQVTLWTTLTLAFAYRAQHLMTADERSAAARRKSAATA